jgi:hypothetical protein
VKTEDFRAYLLELNPNLVFTEHFYERQRYRKISEAKIRECLEDLKDLIDVQDKGLTEHGRHTFSLLFKMLDNYDLRVVISVKEKDLRIVTAHIQDIRKRKGLRKWSESFR